MLSDFVSSSSQAYFDLASRILQRPVSQASEDTLVEASQLAGNASEQTLVAMAQENDAPAVQEDHARSFGRGGAGNIRKRRFTRFNCAISHGFTGTREKANLTEGNESEGEGTFFVC